MRLSVLGPVTAHAGDREVPIGPIKQRTVLATLIAAGGMPVSADSLIMSVYGSEASPSKRRTIQTYVSNLRRELGDVVSPSGRGYAVRTDLATIDAVEFEELYRRATTLSEESPTEASTILRKALGLWRGHAYSDVDSLGQLELEITRLHEMRVSALEARVSADLELGMHMSLVAELEALAIMYPLRERIQALLVLALYRSGRQAEALRVCDRTRRTLLAELGIDPSPEMQDLEDRILRHDSSLVATPRTAIEQMAILAVDVDESMKATPVHQLDTILEDRNDLLGRRAESAGGAIVALRGTSAAASFPSATSAVETARMLLGMNARMAIDVGDVETFDAVTTGPPVTRSMRLAVTGHMDQILLTDAARAALTEEGSIGWTMKALGSHAIRGLDRPAVLFNLGGDGVPSEFPPLELDRLPPPLYDAATSPIAGYELRDHLGRGWAGTVRRAYQPSLGREVVVRSFGPDVATEPDFIRRFEAIALRIARVQHHHQVELLDYWRDPQWAHLVYRLVGPKTLRDHITSGPMTSARIDTVLRGVAAAVGAAHELGLAHGRLRPHNIHYDGHELLYVADAGITSMLAGLAAGPVDEYSRPCGNPEEPAPEDDIYSLGVLIHELLAGSRPTPGQTLRQLDTPADAVMARALSESNSGNYIDPRELIADLGEALGLTGPQGSRAVPQRVGARNPYKGLLAFDEPDHADFFGRGQVIQELAHSARSRRLTVLAGPSGSGKSSIVRAGLIPLVRGDDQPWSGWLVTKMIPGDRPFEELEQAVSRVAIAPIGARLEGLRSGSTPLAGAIEGLLPPGTRLLLIVDQFEELFTHPGAARHLSAFLQMLSDNAVDVDSPVHVIVTVRADFLDRPLSHAAFGEHVRSATIFVRALSRGELADAIAKPAEAVGVDVEPAMVEAICSEAEAQPGSMPVVQQALTELFDQRGDNRLTLEQYRSGGTLKEWIARRADSIHLSFDEQHQALARDMFLRLVNVDAEGNDTRRRVLASELEDLDPRMEEVLERFSVHRLLVFDSDPVTHTRTVEVAHEALITHWPRLRDWLTDAREDLLISQRLEVAATEWSAAGDMSFLLRGARLAHAVDWIERSPIKPSSRTARFIDASAAQAAREDAASNRRRRLIVSSLVAFAGVAVVLASVAWTQRGEAQQSAALGHANELVLEARRAALEDPELGVLLALHAIETFEGLTGQIPGDATTALREALAKQRTIATFEGGELVAVSHDGSTIAALQSDDSIQLWDLRTQRRLRSVIFDDLQPEQMVFTPDGRTLLVRGFTYKHTVLAVDLQSGDIQPASSGVVGDVWTMSPDGRWLLDLAGSMLSAVERASAGTHGLVGVELLPDGAAKGASISNGGLLAYIGVEDPERIHVVDVTTRTDVSTLPNPGDERVFLSFSPDDTRLAVSTRDGIVAVHEVGTGDEVWRASTPSRAATPAWSPDQRMLAVGGEGLLTLFDAAGGTIVDRVVSHRGGSFSYQWVPGTSWLASAGDVDGRVLVIDGSADGPVEIASVPLPEPDADFAFMGDDLILETDSGYAIVDASNGTQLESLGTDVALTASDNHLAQAGDDGSWILREFPSGESISTLPGGFQLEAVSDDGSLVVLETPAGNTQVKAVSGEPFAWALYAGGPLTHAEFSHDGQYVITNNNGTGALSIRVFRATSGELVSAFGAENRDGPAPDVEAEIVGGWALDLSEDDRLLAVGGYDGVVRILDFERLVTGVPAAEAVVRKLQAHHNFILTTSFSPDTRFMVTWGWDEPVKLWDVDSGQLVSEFPAPDSSIEFHPDKPLLYIGRAGRISAYTLDLEELIHIAESRLTRSLTVEECIAYDIESCAS